VSSQPSEADWLRAVGHPYRVEIMGRFLADGTTTPREVADALRLPLGTVAYHVRFLAEHGVLRLAGRTTRRGAAVHHYQLVDRERVASILWGTRARLLVSGFERENGRADRTAALDDQALAELHALTAAYLARVGELALQTRERANAGGEASELTPIAVLLVDDAADDPTRLPWR